MVLLSCNIFFTSILDQVEIENKEGRTVVIPIIVRPCAWEDTPFAKLQALPTDSRPISSWEDKDAACLDVARGIMNLVDKLE